MPAAVEVRLPLAIVTCTGYGASPSFSVTLLSVTVVSPGAPFANAKPPLRPRPASPSERFAPLNDGAPTATASGPLNCVAPVSLNVTVTVPETSRPARPTTCTAPLARSAYLPVVASLKSLKVAFVR